MPSCGRARLGAFVVAFVSSGSHLLGSSSTANATSLAPRLFRAGVGICQQYSALERESPVSLQRSASEGIAATLLADTAGESAGAVGRASASGTGESGGCLLGLNSAGAVLIEFEVLGSPQAPAMPVPLLIDAHVNAAAAATTRTVVSAAGVWVFPADLNHYRNDLDDTPTWEGPIPGLFATACSGQSCRPSSEAGELDGLFSFALVPGVVNLLSVEASGQVTGTGAYQSAATFRGIAIDPGFSVDIDGRAVPGTELYTLHVAQVVPEPSTVALLALGAAPLLALRKRGRRG